MSRRKRPTQPPGRPTAGRRVGRALIVAIVLIFVLILVAGIGIGLLIGGPILLILDYVRRQRFLRRHAGQSFLFVRRKRGWRDFIVRAGGGRAALESAMGGLGFKRAHDRYVHPATPFFVEFPRGPLSIGNDTNIRPVDLKIGRTTIPALSATDSCRDRLAAFYHWSDRQSLRSAVDIALRAKVNMSAIWNWSEREGSSEKFAEFQAELARRRR